MLSKFTRPILKHVSKSNSKLIQNKLQSSLPFSQFTNGVFRTFCLNIEPEGDRLRRSEVLKVRNEAKKLLNDQNKEIEEAQD